MPNVNKVILIGNLTRDPEIRQTGAGNSLASFTLAMTRVYNNPRTGERTEEPCFVDVTAFQRNADVIQKYVHKGDPLFVEGRLRYDSWEDRATGAKRNKLSVVAESIQLLSRRSDGGLPIDGGYYAQAAAPQQQPAQQRRSYGAPATQPAYGNTAPYGDAPAAPQYRPAGNAMPSFTPENDAPAGEAPVDDLPF